MLQWPTGILGDHGLFPLADAGRHEPASVQLSDLTTGCHTEVVTFLCSPQLGPTRLAIYAHKVMRGFRDAS